MMMKTLEDLRDYLVASLKLDPSRVFTWADAGSLTFTQGLENRSFSADYTGNIVITECAHPLDVVFFHVSGFMAVRQPHNAGAKPVTFDADLLKRNLAHLYISLPITEIVTVTDVPEGTSLDALVVPPPVVAEDPVTAEVIAKHVPGGEPID